MVSFVIQSVLLVIIAFILGVILGRLFKQRLSGRDVPSRQVPTNPPPEKLVVEPKITDPQPDRGPTSDKRSTPRPPKEPVASAPSTPIQAGLPKAHLQPAENLKLIKGIGPKSESQLNTLGVNRFQHIAEWSSAEQGHYGKVLAFPGRIEREDWVGQARILAKGGVTEFAKRSDPAGSGKSGSGNKVKAEVGGDSSQAETTKKDSGPVRKIRDDVAVVPTAPAVAPLTTTTVAPAPKVGTSKKPGGLLKSARDDQPDTLSAIGGVGNALVKKMNVLGIYHFDQIARLTKAEQVWLGKALGFPGRPERENWTGEARRLAEGTENPAVKPAKRGQIKSKK